ncbi:MAG: DUF169 domain-containing protein [Candidatus Bathyarchaeia archaeon]
MASISYRELSEKLVKLLELNFYPISIHILKKEPKNLERTNKTSAVCGFLGISEKSSFYALATDHFDCPIGLEVVGFTLDKGRKRSRDKIYSMMVESGIMSKKALANWKRKMPKLKQGFTEAIVYEPLELSHKNPDIVVFKCNPFQSMLLASAIGKELGKETPILSNFPGCCIIPIAYKSKKVVMSLACDGSRKLMPIKPDELLVAISGKELVNLVKELEQYIQGREKFEKYFE